MAATDRTTGRIIAKLKHKVAALTALTVVLAIALGVMTYLYVTKDGEEKGAVGSSSAIASSNEEDVASVSSKPTAEEKAAMALALDLDNWNLRLVNGKKPLPSGFTVTTEKIEATYARDVGMLYDARAVSYLNAMCAAAERDGINLLVISSFRTNERQTVLFNNQVTKQRAIHPELSEEEIKKLAGTISAYPGTSEHEVGLAVDFNSVEESFENTPEFQWLKTNAQSYGFILRYAKEKQDITGVIYEPWHYRYVGEKHAKKINELGYCLEEYVDYLNKYTK
ncbi:MAG: M15 family metallopeptidase [Acutalibacteraceae bacterium]|nr:M15 family metallopeptidase [Acutalibacteraceae bacterium]